MTEYDWSEYGEVEWENLGAKYTLRFEMYAYAYKDEYGGHSGSGVKGLLLTVIKQGKAQGEPLHDWEEIDVDTLKQNKVREYYSMAEEEMENHRGE